MLVLGSSCSSVAGNGCVQYEIWIMHHAVHVLFTCESGCMLGLDHRGLGQHNCEALVG